MEDEDFVSDAMALLRAVNKLLRNKKFREAFYGTYEYTQLSDAAADLEAYYETDDPVQNGWVGADGLP
jgi:hypothetical protein